MLIYLHNKLLMKARSISKFKSRAKDNTKIFSKIVCRPLKIQYFFLHVHLGCIKSKYSPILLILQGSNIKQRINFFDRWDSLMRCIQHNCFLLSTWITR